ncbi:hypothetical protein [Burkholderia seminalis]|uniref:hypothetical protein n=1 Tax=Burkholderia seminalis TaxID=488731 RepID=UPI0031E11E4B
MATNDFLVFGGGSSPNVIDQATYAALAARLSGFQSGTALSAQLNKVWRQSSIMAAVLAQFTANFSGQNAVDDGTTATLLANLQVAINAAGITAPQFDSSTKFATTAFVQRALGNFQAFTAYTSSQTLTASQSGSVINFWGGSASTFTLPSVAAMPPGGAFLFNNTSTSAAVTITRAGSDTILLNGGGTSVVLNPGDSLLIAQAGATQWVVTGGSMQLPYASVMAGPNFATPALGDNSKRLATTAWYWNQIAAGVSSAGKVSGVNSPNLLFNGSGEFGASGWVMAPGPAFSQQVDQTGGIGTFFANASAMSNASGYVGSPLVQIGQNASVTESIDVANFATAGTLVLTLAAYNSSGTFISNVASLTVPNGTPLQRYTLTGTTPTGTASVQAYWTYTGVSASPFGIAIRRLKIEQGATASLYSQEAGIATLAGGMPVVGTARNVAMNVASASATATLTADEIIVCSGLGGVAYKLANFSNTINIAASGGPGGMDTGTAPANGYVAIYAIYNPTTGASALLATNATSTKAPEVYSGANMPPGMKASALLTVVPTNSSGQFVPVLVQDRKVSILQYTALSSSSSSGFTNTALSIAGGVPRNAKRVGGSLSLSNSTAANSVWVFYASSSGAGPQQYSINTTGSGGNLFGFSGLDLSAAQTMQYALLSISAGTCSYIIYISCYEI